MKRSQFLKSALPVGISLMGMQQLLANKYTPGSNSLLPPTLLPGDTIGVTCPAGALDVSQTKDSITLIKKMKFNVILGATVGKHWMVFGGTDEERKADMQAMVNDPNIKAILCARGGYGVMRIMDSIDWSPLIENPKWIIGYSDITALHSHLQTIYGMPSIHADMVNGLDAKFDSSSYSLYEALTGVKAVYKINTTKHNKIGTGVGTLIGGNLSMLCAIQGSNSEIQTQNKILFIEDVREYKYTIDRMLMTLKRSGKLANLSGLIVGGFVRLRDEAADGFNMSMEDIILEKVEGYNYPVCFNFPAGHQSLNMALKLGVAHKLLVSNNYVVLQEL